MKLDIILRFVLAGMFIFSGIGKIFDSLGAERILLYIFAQADTPTLLTRIILIIFSLIEITIGVFLLKEKNKDFWLKIYLGVVSSLTLGLISLIVRGINLPSCGCFGLFIPSGSVRLAVLRNFVILIVGFYILYFREKPIKEIS